VRERNAVDSLTPAERMVASHLAQGGTNKDIARKLSISPKTVGHHLQHIYRKLNVANRQEAIALLTMQINI